MTTINNDQSLIEKVGGIEKAREIAFDPLHPQMTHVSNDGRHWVNEAFAHIPEIQCQIESMIRIDDLRTAISLHEPKMHSHLTSDALQGDDIAKHDFKVGDKVIRLDLNSPHIYSIHKIEDGVYTIARKVRHRTWGTWLECSQIRHATPSEIKAGHRLEAERHG